MVTQLEDVTVLLCPECGEPTKEDDVLWDKLYECQECSGKFLKSNGNGRNGNMCPECGNKFGSRVTENRTEDDKVCPHCEEGALEEVSGYICPFCEEAVTVEDVETHMKYNHTNEIVEEWLDEAQP